MNFKKEFRAITENADKSIVFDTLDKLKKELNPTCGNAEFQERLVGEWKLVGEKLEVPEAIKFRCPVCGELAHPIELTVTGILACVWHKGCGAILGMQLIGFPQGMEPKIQTPGPVRLTDFTKRG